MHISAVGFYTTTSPYIKFSVLWGYNEQNLSCKVGDSIGSTRLLTRRPSKKIKMPWFTVGERFVNIHHTRIRIGCSKLKAHLHFNLHVEDDPSCRCGFGIEDPYHFLLTCPLYAQIRVVMLDSISTVAEKYTHLLAFQISCSPSRKTCSPENFTCSLENFTCSPENFTCSPENFTCSPQHFTSSPVKCSYWPAQFNFPCAHLKLMAVQT